VTGAVTVISVVLAGQHGHRKRKGGGQQGGEAEFGHGNADDFRVGVLDGDEDAKPLKASRPTPIP
jgi:hypothetical protein